MKFRRLLGRIGVGFGVLIAGLVLATGAREKRKFALLAVDIHASRDPAVIERGRYLVTGPAHCGECHGASAGRPPSSPAPLSGGYEFQLPIGVFRAPNITPDVRTGIGRYSDEAIARILRYGVRPDGGAVLPFMPTANMADSDLAAVVSYLRSIAPVEHRVAPHEINALGRLVKAWVLNPPGPTGTPAKEAPHGVSLENGRYLAHNVANCVSCHTKMDLRTGKLIGPTFGGGGEFPSSIETKKTFVSPNLTPDPRWGWIYGWGEQAFSARLTSGVGRDGSPMPWRAFKQLSNDDARAIHLYLLSVPQAAGGPDPRQRNPTLEVASRTL